MQNDSYFSLWCLTLPGLADKTGDVLVSVTGIDGEDQTNEMGIQKTTFTYRVRKFNTMILIEIRVCLPSVLAANIVQ